MNKTLKIIEKIIGGSLIILGIGILILVVWAINTKLQLFYKFYENSNHEISIYKLIKLYHLSFLKGLLGIISGILLLQNKLTGWILSVSTLLIYGVGMIFIAVIKNTEKLALIDLILVGFIVILCLSLAIIMTIEQFRKKYIPKRNSWISIGIIFLIFMIDTLIIN